MHTQTDMSEKLTREQMVEMIMRGFGPDHWNPEGFREWVMARTDEQLGDMVALLEAAGAGKKCQLCEAGFPLVNGNHIPTQSKGMIPVTRCLKAIALRDSLGDEFERLSNAAIEELVVARIHLDCDEFEEATENLIQVNQNLFRLGEILQDCAKGDGREVAA
jgi:hypothetical protein